ncbi:hypothetical protein ACFOWE_27030 [Planomonospora corallina]|uniref:Uncharacterized protein n=1 Tax=Planomonospora corallina TaxID=1806052 RepID=A0ABV8ID34_9ACTN
MPTAMSVSELAEVLFASPLQASDDPSPDRVREVIEDRLRACDEDITECVACVAQEAGDHPEAYRERMRWALRTADRVGSGALAAH